MQNKKLHINVNSVNFSTLKPKLAVKNYMTSGNFFQSKNKYNNESPQNSIIKSFFSNSNRENKLVGEKNLKFYSPYNKLILTNREKEAPQKKYKNLILALSPKTNNQIRSFSFIKKININNNKENKYQQIILEKDEIIKNLLKQIEYYKIIIDYIKKNNNINLDEFADENNVFNNLKTIEYHNDSTKSNINENNDYLKNSRYSNLFRVKQKENINEKSNELFNNSHLSLSVDKKDKNKRTIINNNINIFNSIEIKKKITQKSDHIYLRDSNKNPVRFFLLSNSNNKNNKMIKSEESDTKSNKYLSALNLPVIEDNEVKNYEKFGNSFYRDYKKECENIKNRTKNLIMTLFYIIEKKNINQ